jgi:hypothetical protein
MDRETPCLSCRGTGMICSPCDSRPGYPAHAYKVVCGCGVLRDHPAFAGAGYEIGATLPGALHRQALACAAGWVAWADELLKADIEMLWAAGIPTWSSCQDNGGKWIAITTWAHADQARALLPWITDVKEHPVPAYPTAVILSDRS